MNATDIDSLPNDPVQLKAFIAEMATTYETKFRYMQEQIRILQAREFGRTSEKIPEAAYGQGTLFDETELNAQDDVLSASKSEKLSIGGYIRNKVGRKPLPAYLPREEKVIDLPDEDKIHSCGRTMKYIGEERSEKIKFIPQKVSVEVTVRKKYACPCEGADTPGDSAVRIAPKPAELIPKSYASASLMAHIITSKFCDALPLYRQQKIFKRMDIDIPRQLMSTWIMQIYVRLARMRSFLLRDIRGGPVIGMDETPVQVLNEPGRKNTTKSYMWVARGTKNGKPILLYTYAPTRSSVTANEILGDFTGVIQCDGFSAYDVVAKSERITRAGCWAHVRRKFVDAHKVASGDTLAFEMIQMIGELYGIEQEAIECDLEADEIKKLREEKSRPVVNNIIVWLDQKACEVTPSSTLGKAIQYAHNEWQTLLVYLSDGNVRIDNNLIENAIRPFVLGRKNWLFSGSPLGADASALFYSLIETAKANGLEPFAYLQHLLDRLPHAVTDADFEALLPYTVKLQAKIEKS